MIRARYASQDRQGAPLPKSNVPAGVVDVGVASGVMDTVAGSPPPGNNSVKFGESTGVYHVPGTYTYSCLIHPFMKGEVVVQ